jgi:hypothetical protein
MTATTTPDGLRYPNDYEQPADVPIALGQLAVDTQTALNKRMTVAPAVGEVTAFAAGWAGDATVYGPPRGHKFGRLVTFRGMFIRTGSPLTVTDNQAYDVGTLPAGFRPEVQLRTLATWYANTPTGNFSATPALIFANGDIRFTANSSGTIAVGQWVSLAGITWMVP